MINYRDFRVLWLLVAVSASSSSADYEYTPVEDPLQSVWDRLDNLSQEIFKVFQEKLENQFQQLQREMNEKLESVKSKVEVKTSAINNNIMNNLGHVDNKMAEINRTITSWMQNYYDGHVRNDLDEARRKIEEHVDVKISALENKFVGNINILMNLLAGNASRSSGSLLPSDATVPAGSSALVEQRISNTVTTAVTSLESNLRDQLTHISNVVTSSHSIVDTINTHVSKINDKLSSGDGETGTGTHSCLNDSIAIELISTLEKARETPGFLPRDCSDHHWQQPEAPTGVFQIYPTMDSKAPISAFCEMGDENAKETGGWTVILRRRNTTFGLTNFNRTWAEYRQGFGIPGEGEWWFGLGALHALTYRQPYEVRFLMHDIERGYFHASYSNFRVEDETRNYRLIVNGFTGNVSQDALSTKHHGSPFSTFDRDNDQLSSVNCAVSNSGGWWFNSCYYTTLTAPFPTSANRDAKTIRWLNDNNLWLVLDDVVLMARPAGYSARFNAHLHGE
ncbi:hypothetical protein OTU49_016207 [Cherax quadricarinatus]|uniref:Fibrinogen C-terminal domain-containing protein n=2 Tax=Cherax quadricarinatus TaxID=27406 RepID=A0AAW0XTI5_CHEQU